MIAVEQDNVGLSAWFALCARGGKSEAAERDIQDLGMRTFRPLSRVRVRRRRGPGWASQWIVRDYFSGWLFARCTLSQAARIEHMRYVERLAKTAGMPVSVPDRAMALIMDNADCNGVMRVSDETLRRRFMHGERVVFSRNSPLSGATAKVVADHGRQQVRVLLDILGGRREMNAPVDMLQLIAA